MITQNWDQQEQVIADDVKILIVDDRPENLQALKAILTGQDRRLIAANSGREAIYKLLQDEFALILLDVMMPEIDGFELARLIKTREKTRNVPIIFLTAIATDIEHIFKGYSVGAVDYLSKPLEPEIVKAKVAVFIDLYKKTKTIQKQDKQLREHELAELRRSEQERYENLTESIPQMVWTCDTNGNMDYFNNRWFQYTGLTKEESLDEGWLQPIHPEDREQVKQSWQNQFKSGQTFEMEYRLLRDQDQTYRWHLARAIPIKNGKLRVNEWVGTYTDIEDQKNAQIALNNTLQARDEFFSIASHELKTPLNSLGLKMQILERQILKTTDDVLPKKMVAEAVEFSKNQMFRLESLIDNLLDISRIRLKRLTVDRSRLDLTTIVSEVASRMEDQAKLVDSPITIHNGSSIFGEWDKLRLEQVITNLISNAIKYGNSEPIDVSVSDNGDSAILKVKDHGIGIPKSDQERIFERFERVSPTSGIGGLGLGLYIVKQIVEAHGGTIRLESEVGNGSEFIVELPKKSTDVRTGPAPPPEVSAEI